MYFSEIPWLIIRKFLFGNLAGLPFCFSLKKFRKKIIPNLMLINLPRITCCKKISSSDKNVTIYERKQILWRRKKFTLRNFFDDNTNRLRIKSYTMYIYSLE
jgi:hypothetical protein